MSTTASTAPTTRHGTAITTESLTKTFTGGVAAVDALDMEVRGGEIYGFLGPNGAGKSTTIGMLTTRVSPSAGTARVGDIDVFADPARAKQVIGVVPQTNTLDRALGVAENLEFHGRYFGMGRREARRRTTELLERVRLADRAGAASTALSGGMAQRLMVARAIMHRPRVLFLDEPTAGLDPQSRLALWDILTEIHRDGQTILLTTHHMDEADELCDRVAIIDHGRFLAVDTPATLKASVGAERVITVSTEPLAGNGAAGDAQGDRADATAIDATATHATATHADTAEVLATTLIEDLDEISGATVTEHDLRLSVRRTDGVLPRVITTAERVGHRITDLSVSEPSLETVFIALTGRELRE